LGHPVDYIGSLSIKRRRSYDLMALYKCVYYYHYYYKEFCSDLSSLRHARCATFVVVCGGTAKVIS